MEKRRPISFLKRNMLLLGVSLVVVSLLFSIFRFVTLHNAHASSSPAMTPQQLAAFGEANCIQPPQHINLKTLSDAQLIEYGFPTHAVIDQNLAQWQLELASAKYRSCGATTPTGSGLTHVLQPSQQTAQPQASLPTQFIPNWSGYVVHAARGTYRAAMVTFKVPTLKAGAKGAHVSIWAGIGDGSNPFDLVQAGIDSTLTNGKQSNSSWWEVVSNTPGNVSLAEQALPLKKGVANGNTIFVYVDSNLNFDNLDTFFIENQTTHEFSQHSAEGAKYLSDSASGECVVERPAINHGFSPLANFGAEAMTKCELEAVGSKVLKPIADFNSQRMVMTNNAGTADLDAVSALSSGQNFTVTYKKPD